MMSEQFPHYTTEYIGRVMSLRSPQKKSLEILADIVNNIGLKKNRNLTVDLATVHNSYDICSDFERSFASLAFALATGVGKTRLMGAFITYLYTNWNIKHFLVVAPNTTIYRKLISDLGDSASSKYVFKGLGCFNNLPEIITGDDYSNKSTSTSEVSICVFNIDKFNKETSKMKKLSEYWGKSFYDYLSGLDDLVLLMDESHHYRAKAGWAAINELNPVLGLELTATPKYNEGSSQKKFKNVVYEYTLAEAIKDGYTRTPFALTRTDIDIRNFGDEEVDKMMLLDGIAHHEVVRAELGVYAKNHNKPLVKPFVLVVCKDTAHAEKVKAFICSDNFKNGYYINRTITVHSKQSGEETEENTKLLLSVESPDNPIEIVIHVNKLKEGWDVNNLYTIIPLRTATSAILREQMVGRGLRLPYGERVGDAVIDRVTLTAHDKFADLLTAAQRGDSIFNAEHIIHAEDLQKDTYTGQAQLALPFRDESKEKTIEKYGFTDNEETDALLEKAQTMLAQKVQEEIVRNYGDIKKIDTNAVVEQVKEELQNSDFGEKLKNEAEPFDKYIKELAKPLPQQALEHYIPIPVMTVTDKSDIHYDYDEFEPDLSVFNQRPITDQIIIRNMLDQAQEQRLEGEHYTFDVENPEKILIKEIRSNTKYSEIDYEEISDLLYKLIEKICSHYEKQFGKEGLNNVILLNKGEIAEQIVKQIMQHRHREGEIYSLEEINQLRDYNFHEEYSWSKKLNLYDNLDGLGSTIKGILFTGIEKGVFECTKFDSTQEVIYARILENEVLVLNWLRPAAREFDIRYGNERRNYEPDFVVETKNIIYMVEIKADNELDSTDVLAKKRRAEKYCELATNWGEEHGYKKWQYILIPHSSIQSNSSFDNLMKRYKCEGIVSERHEFAVGDEVYSKTFGNGIVKVFSDDMIKVDFNGLMKAYIYPDCFEDKELELFEKEKY